MESATRTAIQLSDAVGKEIRVLLLRRDMKQTELAAKMGVGEMWLSRRLRGAQEIGLNDLQRIAQALDVEATTLLPRSDEGRVITTVGSHNPGFTRAARRLRRGPNRTSTKPRQVTRHPIGRPETGTTAQTPAGSPSQRRPGLVAHRSRG